MHLLFFWWLERTEPPIVEVLLSRLTSDEPLQSSQSPIMGMRETLVSPCRCTGSAQRTGMLCHSGRLYERKLRPISDKCVLMSV